MNFIDEVLDSYIVFNINQRESINTEPKCFTCEIINEK